MIPNEYDRLVICNGCRPSWLSDKIPDKLERVLAPYFDEIFKEACNKHDICYYIGGDLKQFKKCNKAFYKAMKKSIRRNSHWYSRLWFYYKAWQYYKLVQKWGKSSFYFNSGSGLNRILPSYQPYKSTELRELGVESIWKYNRWWTRAEAKKLNII